MNNHSGKRFFVWLLGSLIVACLFSSALLCVCRAEYVSSKVGDADVVVRQAFKVALDAEKAGANVSGLMVRLNDAGALLDSAENALSKGNVSEAANEADQCIGIAQSVESDSAVLKSSALSSANSVFWSSLVFSSVGIAVFVVCLVFVWRRFKPRCVEKALGAKPEVTSE